MKKEMVAFDYDAFKEAAHVAKMKLGEISEAMGKNPYYLASCGGKGWIEKSSLLMACGIVGARADDMILPDEDLEPEEKFGPENDFRGFSVAIREEGDKLVFSMFSEGKEVYYRTADIKYEGLMGAVQAINFAFWKVGQDASSGEVFCRSGVANREDR